MAKRAGVREIDHGWKKIREELKKLSKKPLVKVGFQAEEDKRKKKGADSGTTVLQVALVHEYGSKKKKIPERSMIRSTRDKHAQKHEQQMLTLGEQVVLGKMTAEKALKIIGLMAQKDIQFTFTENDWPELKDPTRGGKNESGDAKPLLDTGQLRSSVRFKVIMDGRKE